MDEFFLENVPDLSRWGAIQQQNFDGPRPHTCDILRCQINDQSPIYQTIIEDMACVIASTRLTREYFNLWAQAAKRTHQLSPENMKSIACALARGIATSQSNYEQGMPECNDENLKGHIAEILLFCLRVNLLGRDRVSQYLFQPPRPKENPSTPGIDLFELGQSDDGYYFQLWECKGTDDYIEQRLSEAAKQLCLFHRTAKQSFMEAYRSIVDLIPSGNSGLLDFYNQIPRRFFNSLPHESKRLGGSITFSLSEEQPNLTLFAKHVNGAVSGRHVHCHVAIVSIINFPKFRNDVYKYLWNIY